MNVHITVDTTGLARGIAAASKYSKRTLPQIVNTSAYWVAVNAKNAMPFVRPEKVDVELGVIVSPVIGKRGKALKNRKFYSGGAKAKSGAPLAAMIVVARARKGSGYNQRTNNRYALAANPFKGLTREAGRDAMQKAVDLMIKSRRRSGKFLLAGWLPAVRELAKHAVNKFIRGGASPFDGAKNYFGADLGSAEPAAEGFTAQATIENAVGTEGPNAQNYNAALQIYGRPALQAAIDREGEQQMAYALSKMGDELRQVVDSHWR